MADKVLYLNIKSPSVIRHSQLAGFRRYATARGWEVVTIPEGDSSPEKLPHFFAKYAPIGCAVDCTGIGYQIPLSAFGRMPVVYLGAESAAHPNAPHIEADNGAIAQTAFRALAAGRPSAYAVVCHRRGPMWSKTRVRVFTDIARATGAKCAVFSPKNAESTGDWIRRLARWLGARPRGCAVFATSDHVAAAIIGASRLARLSIPRDFTLLGVDDIAKICEKCRPRLSSVRFDYERAGFRAARMLDMAISGRTAPQPHETVVPFLVVRRESTLGTGRVGPEVLAALEVIRREACDGLSAARAAARAPGSRRLLEIRFREAVGHSILDEIHEVRLEKVQALLARGDMPVTAIADFCGFNSYHVLHRLFKAHTGMTMCQWRRRYSGQ